MLTENNIFILDIKRESRSDERFYKRVDKLVSVKVKRHRKVKNHSADLKVRQELVDKRVCVVYGLKYVEKNVYEVKKIVDSIVKSADCDKEHEVRYHIEKYGYGIREELLNECEQRFKEVVDTVAVLRNNTLARIYSRVIILICDKVAVCRNSLHKRNPCVIVACISGDCYKIEYRKIFVKSEESDKKRQGRSKRADCS